MHKWAPEDDIVALYLYRCESRSKIRGIPYSFEQIVATRRMPLGSLKRRMDNFEFLDTGRPKGASNYATQSKAIYEEHKADSCEVLRSEAIRILSG